MSTDHTIHNIPPRIVECEWCRQDSLDMQLGCHYCQGTRRTPVPLSEMLHTEGTWHETWQFYSKNNITYEKVRI
jgi:hypothetical protein